MPTMRTDEFVELRTEVTDVPAEEIRADAGSVTSFARWLLAAGVPDAMVRKVASSAVGALAQGSIAVPDVTEFLLSVDDDPVESLEPVRVPLLVLGAAAPAEPGSSVSVTLSRQRSGEGALELTLFSTGTKVGVKRTVRDDLTIECPAGEGRYGFLLIPALRETRMVLPPGASERFPVTRLLPSKDANIGLRASRADVREVLAAASGRPVPVGGGDAPFKAARATDMELSWSFELGVEFTESNKLGISVGVAGSVGVEVEYALPVGSFDLHWLSRPAGACLRESGTAQLEST